MEDAIIAETAGADRIEINSALLLGGLTPTVGCVQSILDHISIPAIAMCRPRPSGFCYSQHEFETLDRDACIMLDLGVSGIAFGVLNENRQVDELRCRQLVERAGDCDTVFHRAFDLVADWQREIKVLIDCGVRRVMTSGQRQSAWQGREKIGEMLAFVDGQIEILAAGGIRSDTVAQLVKQTGITQIHAGPSVDITDPSQPAGGPVSFYADPPSPNLYRRIDADRVHDLVKCLKNPPDPPLAKGGIAT